MNKHLVFIGIIVIFGSVGLSGCTNQTNNNQYRDHVDVSDVTIMTKWWAYGEGETQVPGFHQVPENSSYQSYDLEGIMTNIGDRAIAEIQFNASFLDASGTVITTRTTYVRTLSSGSSQPFWVGVHKEYEPLFDSITDCTWEITRVIFQ